MSEATRELIDKHASGVRVDAPHHCAPEDIDALLRWLDAINDPQQEALPSLENTDWRGRAGVIARVIRYLCGTLVERDPCDPSLLGKRIGYYPDGEPFGYITEQERADALAAHASKESLQ